MAATEKNAAVRIDDLQINTRCNLALISALLVLVAGLVGYHYWQFRQLTEPENLVQLAETRIEEGYPEMRANLKAELVDRAPELAEELSAQTIRSLPEAREELVEYLGRQLGLGLDQATDYSAEEFREILRENRDVVLEGVSEVQAFPQKAERFVLQMEQRLEKRWDADVQAQSRFLLVTHRQFNDKLERLSRSSQLSPQDLLARQILRIVRAISLRATTSPSDGTNAPGAG